MEDGVPDVPVGVAEGEGADCGVFLAEGSIRGDNYPKTDCSRHDQSFLV